MTHPAPDEPQKDDAQLRAEQQAQVEQTLNATMPPWVGIAALLLIAVFIAGYWHLQSQPRVIDPVAMQKQGEALAQKQLEERQYSFMAACERSIRKQLKNPDGAKFVDLDYRNVQGQDGSFTLVGQVDGTNSFGATIRTPFTCTQEGESALGRLVE